MSVIQRGIFFSSIWLGWMTSDDHIRTAWPFLAPALFMLFAFHAVRRAAPAR